MDQFIKDFETKNVITKKTAPTATATVTATAAVTAIPIKAIKAIEPIEPIEQIEPIELIDQVAKPKKKLIKKKIIIVEDNDNLPIKPNTTNNTNTTNKATNTKAAITIQRFVRGHLVRRKLNPEKYIQYYIQNHLSKQNIKKLGKTSALYHGLVYLYLNMKKAVNINDIRQYVINKGLELTGSDALQIRHLGLQYGFNIRKGGELYNKSKIQKSHYMLVNLTKTYGGFTSEKRCVKLNDESWAKILKEYDNQCVNCGSENGKPLRWSKNKITVLEQGHMNPLKALTEDNVIPQCTICNKQYKNKAIFNKRGCVIKYNEKGFIT